MDPQDEHRADQLEELLSSHLDQNSWAQMRPAVPDGVDPEVREMAKLAQHLQTSPALIPDPAFVKRLERKVLARRAGHRQTNELRDKQHWLISRVRALHVQFVSAILLLCLLIGTNAILTKATTVSSPDNPLYGVKVWEQQVQLSFASSSQKRAEVSLHIIRDRLNTIPNLTDASHAEAYQQALKDIQQQIDTVTSIIDTLPAGSDRQNLSTELATLKTDTRHTLYSVLAKIPLAEQLTTTTILGQLGMPVPSIQNVTMAVFPYPISRAIVIIIGLNLTETTHLIVDNHVIASVCELQDDSCIFTIPLQDKNPPTAIAVLNADGTAAQTTIITFVYASKNNISENDKNYSDGDSQYYKYNQHYDNGDNQKYDNEDNQHHSNGDNQKYDNEDNQHHDNEDNQHHSNGDNQKYDNRDNQRHGNENSQHYGNRNNQHYTNGNDQKHASGNNQKHSSEFNKESG